MDGMVAVNPPLHLAAGCVLLGVNMALSMVTAGRPPDDAVRYVHNMSQRSD